MPAPSSAESLTPELAARLSEFARACKAATRIVSLYPAQHPAIQSALRRIVEASRQALAGGPLVITVLPDDLLVDGRRLAKPDPTVTELAVLLHQQLIGELVIQSPPDGTAWHAFLSLLAKPPEELRVAGGIGEAWRASGTSAISFKEIDYGEMLREKGGGPANAEEATAWDAIITRCLQGDEEVALDDETMATMLELAVDADRLAAFAGRLQEQQRGSDGDPSRQRRAVLQLMHALANYAARTAPDQLDTVLQSMAGAATRLSPDLLLALMMEAPPPAPDGSDPPGLDVAKELQPRLTAELMARFVADNVAQDRGATQRLATAFHALVPDLDKQREVLALASQQLAGVTPAGDTQLEHVWSSSLDLLMSYSDKPFVSEEYARELSSARAQAVEVERVSDDPPERLRAWLSTISERDVHELDLRLALDLLAVERRPDAWKDVLDVALKRIDGLLAGGELTLAAQVVEAVAAAARDAASPVHDAAAAGLARLGQGRFVKQVVAHLRTAGDAESALAAHLCTLVGPVLLAPLAAALGSEENPRAARRLRDLIIRFGAAAREQAIELRGSPNPSVRRAAIDLLRALGGNDALPDLRKMLDDTETQVQRDALRAIVQIGTDQAYAMLGEALETGAPHTRVAITQAIGTFRDERAAPLFVYILRHSAYTGVFESVYLSAVEALGRVGADHQSVDALRAILYRGQWWAPRRTARMRAAAARALRAMNTTGAREALEEAATRGPRAVRRAARAALEVPAPGTSIRRHT
jgi:hypothetical protein